MRHLKLSLSIAVVAAFLGCSTPAKQKTTGGTVFTAPVVESSTGFQLRPYGEKTLENGLRIVYVEDNALPYVSYSLMLKTGSSSDPLASPGLSLFVSELLEKGTAKRSALEVADALGRIGADFATSVASDYSMVSGSSLSSHAEKMLGLLLEIVTQPTFSEGEIMRMRQQLLAAIEKRIDNPEALAETAWDDFLFENHPYAKPALGTSRSIQGIKRKTLIQHYLRHYRPNNAILAVTGKLTPELMASVEKAFMTWKRSNVPQVTYPQFPPIQGVTVRLVENPALVQAQIRIGHKGIKRQSADFIPLRVANTILGGAFASRLMNRVRKELGLTYGISSGFDARLDYGPFSIDTFTKNESTGQAITETLKVLETFKKEGATDEEVKRAKGYLQGVFPTAIETAEKFAHNLLVLRLYGIPDTFLSHYLRDLDRVSQSDVNRVIQQYLDPANLKILVYSSKAVLPQLQSIGIVEVKKASDFQ
jgi:zinc protease